MEMENHYVPNDSTIFEPQKEIRKNFFGSPIFFNEIKPEIKEPKKESNNLLKELEDILICCICYNYLDNPVNDPTCCPHYACKACLEKYFKQKKTLMVPCPLCRKYLKKKNLIKIPIFDTIKEILKDAKKSDGFNIEENEIIDEMCRTHSKNKIFYICLDCKVKMCPICHDELKKHENHHLVHYGRYVQLFKFFHKNFNDLKQTISENEIKIKEYNQLIGKLELQKNSYLNFLNDISHQIKKVYMNSQEKINKEIAKSMEIIAKLRNFMINIKSHVSLQFKNSYNDLDNIEEIQKEIKNRIDKLNLNEMNKIDLNIKENSFKKLNGIKKEDHHLIIDKILLCQNNNICTDLDNSGNFSFGVEISEKDKTMITIYLDIKKFINNKPNEASYMALLEFNNKIIYLEPFEINKELYSYDYSLPINEFFIDKEVNKNVNLTILSLNLD